MRKSWVLTSERTTRRKMYLSLTPYLLMYVHGQCVIWFWLQTMLLPSVKTGSSEVRHAIRQSGHDRFLASSGQSRFRLRYRPLPSFAHQTNAKWRTFSVSGFGWYALQGKAENLGWVKDEKNTEIRAKLKKSSVGLMRRATKTIPNSIVLRITLTEGTITDNEESTVNGCLKLISPIKRRGKHIGRA